MSLFERYLSLWVALAIGVGIGLGEAVPGVFAALAGLEYAKVNLVVALLIWAMVYPMMLGVDLGSLGRVAQQPRGLFITLIVNWLVKPFTMAVPWDTLVLSVLLYVLVPLIAGVLTRRRLLSRPKGAMVLQDFTLVLKPWSVIGLLATVTILFGFQGPTILAQPLLIAISLFGLNSGAALATVVGVLVEVPVMLSLVAFANRTRPAYERRARG